LEEVNVRDYTEIKKEISQLVETGMKMYKALEPVQETAKKTNGPKCVDINFFLENYEGWYTRAQTVIKQITPDRKEDFIRLYYTQNRKVLDRTTYCITDALRNIYGPHPVRYGPYTARRCIYNQLKMVEACLNKFDSRVLDMQTILQADIFDSELESASHLLKMGFLRAAGAICGVVLEKHFQGVCQSRNIILRKKNPTIADYNDALKECVYDTVEWRRIQRLGDIRNLCDHSKDREPTKDEVSELISGTERVTKTIY